MTKKNLSGTIITILLFYLFLASSLSTALSTKESNNINNKLVKTRQDKDHVKAKLVINKKKTNKLMHELQKSEEEISKITKDLYNLSKSLQQEKKLYNELQTKFTTTMAKYKINQNILSKQIQLTYHLGKLPQIKLFLGNYDPNTVNRLLMYYGYIYHHQDQQLKNSTAILKDVQILKEAMQQKIASIRSSQIKKVNQIGKLKTTKAVRATLLIDINKAIIQDNKTLVLLQRDEKMLERKITQLQKTFKPTTNINVSIQNKAIFDNLSPHKPIISKSAKIKMRAISSTNPNRFLIQADPGSKVYAIHDGRVIFADWLRGYGLLLIIEHNNDLMSLYGHNQTLFKKVGDKVNRGEAIALVGQSGGQMLPGLYFEIRKSAKSINLRNWFDYETT